MRIFSYKKNILTEKFTFSMRDELASVQWVAIHNINRYPLIKIYFVCECVLVLGCEQNLFVSFYAVLFVVTEHECNCEYVCVCCCWAFAASIFSFLNIYFSLCLCFVYLLHFVFTGVCARAFCAAFKRPCHGS